IFLLGLVQRAKMMKFLFARGIFQRIDLLPVRFSALYGSVIAFFLCAALILPRRNGQTLRFISSSGGGYHGKVTGSQGLFGVFSRCRSRTPAAECALSSLHLLFRCGLPW